MRRAGRKEPEIARLHVFDEAVSVVIDCGDSRSASQHQRPFCRIVPMKFADAAGGQAHIDSSDILGDWKVFHRHLPGPATRLNATMLDGERIPERFDFAMIGWRRQEAIWAGLTQELVFWSWIACALPILGFGNFLNILCALFDSGAHRFPTDSSTRVFAVRAGGVFWLHSFSNSCQNPSGSGFFACARPSGTAVARPSSSSGSRVSAILARIMRLRIPRITSGLFAASTRICSTLSLDPRAPRNSSRTPRS